jgi:hypothetical protein
MGKSITRHTLESRRSKTVVQYLKIISRKTMAKIKSVVPGILVCLLFTPVTSVAEGIVSKIVNSPLSAAGLVNGANTGINIHLQSEDAPGIEFMDPAVIGYGVPPGGRIDIELGDGFERVGDVALTQKTMMVVTGAPQQGMPGKAVGYTVGEGMNANTISITPTSPDGLAAEQLMSPAPGVKFDPVPSRGIKVFHIGLLESAFANNGHKGSVTVRIMDGAGLVVEQGSASVKFLESPVPQIQPSNFPDANRNHNWQVISPGETLGHTPGTVPIPVTIYARAEGTTPHDISGFKEGMPGVGVLSTQQLKAMEFQKPASISRYGGGLIVQDTNNDGFLDPTVDRIIGGVFGKAPEGAMGQELRSLDIHGAEDLSRPTSAFNPKFGGIFGGSTMLLQFTAGNKTGKYRPTLALLSDPDNLDSPDGSSYTFTIVVK